MKYTSIAVAPSVFPEPHTHELFFMCVHVRWAFPDDLEKSVLVRTILLFRRLIVCPTLILFCVLRRSMQTGFQKLLTLASGAIFPLRIYPRPLQLIYS